MKVITAASVHDALASLVPQLASVLPDDILAGLIAAREVETGDRARIVLDQLVENARIAKQDKVPICQDTGTVWVCLEVGPDVLVPGNVLSRVNEAVAFAYEHARLRKSVVRDALFDRANTGDNTPAFCEIHTTEELGAARLHVMLKGGGSDNASRVVMLTPSAGAQGIIDTVLQCVREKAANACPPLIVGVGIGATFDKVAGLAKHALMRPLGQNHPNPQTAQFEAELLSAINATGIGAGAIQNGEFIGGMGHTEAGHVYVPLHPNDVANEFNGTCPFHRGCLEGLAAGPSLEARTGIRGELIEQNSEVWDIQAYYIAQAAVQATVLYRPEVIVFGGGVMGQEHMLRRVREKFTTLLNGYLPVPDVTEYIVTPAVSGNGSATLGNFALAKDVADKHSRK